MAGLLGLHHLERGSRWTTAAATSPTQNHGCHPTMNGHAPLSIVFRAVTYTQPAQQLSRAHSGLRAWVGGVRDGPR